VRDAHAARAGAPPAIIASTAPVASAPMAQTTASSPAMWPATAWPSVMVPVKSFIFSLLYRFVDDLSFYG
jgi:hypothetical protein